MWMNTISGTCHIKRQSGRNSTALVSCKAKLLILKVNLHENSKTFASCNARLVIFNAVRRSVRQSCPNRFTKVVDLHSLDRRTQSTFLVIVIVYRHKSEHRRCSWRFTCLTSPCIHKNRLAKRRFCLSEITQKIIKIQLHQTRGHHFEEDYTTRILFFLVPDVG